MYNSTQLIQGKNMINFLIFLTLIAIGLSFVRFLKLPYLNDKVFNMARKECFTRIKYVR